MIPSSTIGLRRAAAVGTLFLIGICATASQAHDGTWTIVRHSGDVRLVNDGVVLSSLSDNMALRPGTGIKTGENGRVMLTHAGESMMISPNSSITIPDTFAKDGYSTLLQKRGSVLFEVEKQNGRPFQVLTPYLAAAVKGTQFTVTLASDDNRVEVFDGLVDVTEFRSGQIGSVSAGQSAIVLTSSEGLRITGNGFVQPIKQGTPLPSPIVPDVDAEQNADAGLPASAASSPPAPTAGGRSSGVSQTSNWSDPDFNWLNHLALPTAFGFAVAFGVAIRTQRKNKKRKEKEKEIDKFKRN